MKNNNLRYRIDVFDSSGNKVTSKSVNTAWSMYAKLARLEKQFPAPDFDIELYWLDQLGNTSHIVEANLYYN